jgi:hypothetical protein
MLSISKIHLRRDILLRKFSSKSYFHQTNQFKMPLVVPGITPGGDKSKTEEWSNKLVGKKLGEGSDAAVSLLRFATRGLRFNLY